MNSPPGFQGSRRPSGTGIRATRSEALQAGGHGFYFPAVRGWPVTRALGPFIEVSWRGQVRDDRGPSTAPAHTKHVPSSLLPGPHTNTFKEKSPPTSVSLFVQNLQITAAFSVFLRAGPSLGVFVFHFHLPDLFSHKIQ